MINVIYVSHETSADTMLGSSLSLVNLVHSVEKDCNVYIVTPNRGRTYQFFSENGYDCIAVPFPKGTISNKRKIRNVIIFVPKLLKYIIWNFLCLVRLAIYFHGKSIQIIHSNSSVIDFGYYLAKVLHAKHVWHLRELQDLDFSIKPFLGWKRLKRLINKSDYSISITDTVAKHYDLIGTQHSIILGDAVRRASEALTVWPKENYFLFCGHICPAKGADWAVKAFSKFCHSMKEKAEGYKLLMCGQCSEKYKQELLELDSTINDRISFLGYQTDVSRYFTRAKAFLMCSQNEGLGRVTIEAMFYGCPVIGRNKGGTITLLGGGKYGYPFDTIKQCADIMRLIVTKKDASKEKVMAAQSFAIDNFSEEVYGKEILKIYKKLVEDS